MSRDRLIGAYTPSKWDGDPAILRMDRVIVDSGWENWVHARVWPDVEWGLRRCLLHMPVGRESGDYMADMYQKAATLGLKNVVGMKGFSAAFKPLVNHGTEFVWYGGMFRHCPRFERMKQTRAIDNWLSNAIDSLRLPLDLGMSIAIDASALLNEDDPEFALMELLRRLGVRVYVEAASNAAHLIEYPQLIVDATYRSERGKGFVPRTIEEFCRWPQIPPSNAWTSQWVESVTREIQADGHTAIVAVEWLRSGGVKRDELN